MQSFRPRAWQHMAMVHMSMFETDAMEAIRIKLIVLLIYLRKQAQFAAPGWRIFTTPNRIEGGKPLTSILGLRYPAYDIAARHRMGSATRSYSSPALHDQKTPGVPTCALRGDAGREMTRYTRLRFTFPFPRGISRPRWLPCSPYRRRKWPADNAGRQRLRRRKRRGPP